MEVDGVQFGFMAEGVRRMLFSWSVGCGRGRLMGILGVSAGMHKCG